AGCLLSPCATADLFGVLNHPGAIDAAGEWVYGPVSRAVANKFGYSWSLLMENELSCLDFGSDAIARHELSFQQRETQRVEQAALNHPLKRSRTVYRIVSFFGQQPFGTFAKSQLEMLLFEPPQHARQLNFNDLGQLLISESIEDDYLVYPVQEFRPEMVAERFHDSTISFR